MTNHNGNDKGVVVLVHPEETLAKEVAKRGYKVVEAGATLDSTKNLENVVAVWSCGDDTALANELVEHYHLDAKLKTPDFDFSKLSVPYQPTTSTVAQEGQHEYKVELVSCGGVHKIIMGYHYDMETANGARIVQSKTPISMTPQLVEFATKVLYELNIAYGPTTLQLVESSQHQFSLLSVSNKCVPGKLRAFVKALVTGKCSHIEATVDAYLDADAFQTLPDCYTLHTNMHGKIVNLVSYSKGTVKSTPGFEVLQKLPSFVSLETTIKKGSNVSYTTDQTSILGSVVLLHPNKDSFDMDCQFLDYLQSIHGLLQLESKLENLKRPHYENLYQDAVSKHQQGPSLVRHMSNDRAIFKSGLMKRVTTIDASQEVAVIVDPYSTGCCIVEEIMKRGYTVMALWTKGFAPEMKLHVPLSVLGKIKYAVELDEQDDLASTVQHVYQAAGKKRVVACIAGGEAGVDFADALSERLNLRSNGTRIPNKRDKKLQQELVAKAGLRSVRQACGTKFEEVESFLRTEEFPLVLKPVESAGSDGVKLCHSFEEAKEHFVVLMKSQMVNGGECPAVLCQEFLRGKEYVVDHVSREGQHKTVMCWVYDKRPANGSAFVYFGCVPVASDSPEAKILIPYVRGVLDAIDIKNGPSHGEVMMTSDGPCLVEMNCRAHGGDGNWRPLCLGLTGGYSQVEAAVDSYLDSRQFTLLPDKPPAPFKASGQEVILVSFSRGKVKSTPGYEIIKKLDSFVYLETGIKQGSVVDYTIDLFTGIGSAILMHEDERVLQRDVERIRQLERDNLLFEYEPSSSSFFTSASALDLAAMISTSNRPELY